MHSKYCCFCSYFDAKLSYTVTKRGFDLLMIRSALSNLGDQKVMPSVNAAYVVVMTKLIELNTSLPVSRSKWQHIYIYSIFDLGYILKCYLFVSLEKLTTDRSEKEKEDRG